MEQNNIILFSLSQVELIKIIREAVKIELSASLENKHEKELMNFKETCEFLGIHTSTLNKWKAENKIPFKRLGKRIFFNRIDVLSALKESKYFKTKKL